MKKKGLSAEARSVLGATKQNVNAGKNSDYNLNISKKLQGISVKTGMNVKPGKQA